MIPLNFNAAQVPPQQAFEALPPGWYNAVIDQSELKPTKANDGSYLELRFSILDGPYVNRKVFTRLNLDNPNQTAVEIAYGSLSAICHAVGVIQCEHAEMLHNLPLQIKLSLRPANDNYDASNEVKGFKACEAGATASSGTAAAGSGAPAWANKQKPETVAQSSPAQTSSAPAWANKQKPAESQVKAEESAAPSHTTVEEQKPVTGQTSAAAAKPPWVK